MILNSKIPVQLVQNTYNVQVGLGCLNKLLLESQALINKKQLLIVSHESLRKTYAEPISKLLGPICKHIHIVCVPEGEEAKSWTYVQHILDNLFEHHFERVDVMMAVGGGIIGDLTGFCAAIYKRGLAFIQFPTSLLAQVDAAIGGKTGINVAAGKNLIGSFHQPKTVICSLDCLTTLATEEIQNGFAEIIKYAFAVNKKVYHLLTQNLKDYTSFKPQQNPKAWFDLICECIQSKAAVVAQDEKESKLREVLNYGHTLGHAIEKKHHYKISHGKAVATGMLLESLLSQYLGLCEPELVSNLKHILKTFNFKHQLNQEDANFLIKASMQDKKTKAGKTPILVPKEIGSHQKIYLNSIPNLETLLIQAIKEAKS